jgi:hypothetical protein
LIAAGEKGALQHSRPALPSLERAWRRSQVEDEKKPVAVRREELFADLKRCARHDTGAIGERRAAIRERLRKDYASWAPLELLQMFPQLAVDPEAKWSQSVKLVDRLSKKDDLRMRSAWDWLAALPLREGQTLQNRQWEFFSAIEEAIREAGSRWESKPAGERRSIADRIARDARKLARLLHGTPHDVTIPEVLGDDAAMRAFQFLRADVAEVIERSDFGRARALGEVLLDGKRISAALKVLADRVERAAIPRPLALRAHSTQARTRRFVRSLDSRLRALLGEDFQTVATVADVASVVLALDGFDVRDAAELLRKRKHPAALTRQKST